MKYIANPVVVDAMQIVKIGEVETDGSRILSLDEKNADLGIQYCLQASNEMLCRIPHIAIGDYVVKQEDGYVYLNHAAVFERKYSPYVETPATPPVQPEAKQPGIIERIKTAGLDGLNSIIRANAEDGE